MKAALAFLALSSLALLGVLVYDIRVCVMLADWYGFALDCVILAIVSGGWAGLAYALAREIAWQKVHK